ncbi:MAG TPA: M28 family peptidase [Vicinamibacterales bacterium]|nr:M28 family peptidase [Vicinamibacterales bacterium]
MTLRAAILVLAVTSLSLQAQSSAPAIDSIRQDDLRADLFFLGSDAMRGRLTNTPENLIASEWIKARFERLGLAPAVPGYFQNYNLMTVTLGEGNALEIMEGGSASPVAHGQGFSTQRFSATGEARGPVVFAGYGISAPDLDHDDYRAADLIKGSIVLVVDHEPGERDPNSPFDGVVTSDAGGALRKAQAAQSKGAAGILYVSDVHNHPGAAANTGANFWPQQPSRLGSYSLAGWMESIKIPAAQISVELATRLIKDTGKTLEDLSKSADTPRGAAAVRLPSVEVRLTTAVNRQPLPDRNVLAKIEGSDARLRDEWVVISAHFDHDGANGPQIMNGADDDGSGTVGLLEIAEAYALAAKAGQRPRRSILFAAFNSEERGLLGAWAYTLQPIAPLDKTVAVLNMDMIGRNEEVPAPDPAAAAGGRGGNPRFNGLDPQTADSNANALNIIGSVRSPDLKAQVESANKVADLQIRYRYDNNVSQLMRRSDQWPFIQNGVPGIWIFTGLHPDYHTVNDDPDRINYVKMEKILRLVHQMSWTIAQQDGRPGLLPRAKT